MGETVAVIFLRARGRVLLQRANARAPWQPPTTEFYDDPRRAVEQWVRSRFDTNPTIVRTGNNLNVDGISGIPVLADLDDRSDPPAGGFGWLHPTVMATDSVTWDAYRSISPDEASVLEDYEHGSAWLSIRALEIVRDIARTERSMSSVTRVAKKLATGRPEMAVLTNRLDRAMQATNTTDEVHTSCRYEIDRAMVADHIAAARAGPMLADIAALTLSRSGTILRAIQEGQPNRVGVLESRPGAEGVQVAATLSNMGYDIDLWPDAAVTEAIERSDVVIVGADRIEDNGAVHNKLGTRNLARVAHHEEIPFLVATSSDKIAATPETWSQRIRRTVDETPDKAPLFDRTPTEYIDAIVTERGVLGAAEILTLAEQHRNRGRWRSQNGP